ncbi:MAG: L,D-transpeptidase [Candidatus Aminicenantes bacterium]|nr:L,D-transpeptidase [Candidatus Aminicenantes bacterium]MDH5705959.1 L,D-transpeptidase [Candidatus Aminicenantes bacterium]
MSKKKSFVAACIPLGALLLIFMSLAIAGHLIAVQSSSQRKNISVENNPGQAGWGETSPMNNDLRRRIVNLSPRELYIVMDTANNILYLKKGEQTIRKCVISCGSGNILSEPGGGRKWIFDTPKGEFFVKSKIREPYWIKPDWAFIEEGKDVPKDAKDRVEADFLGEYALGFGDGYFIHGTLYTRLLGRNVTHGCIRVGDEDLRELYMAASIGTKIFIF